jgi:glycine oxidase
MTDLTGARIVVAGAGVFGLATALAAAWAGARVDLYDPRLARRRSLGNASSVAAGMLAPAFEAVLDPASAGHFDLLRQGRDLWPGLLARLEASDALVRSGALYVADGGQAEAAGRIAAALAAAGAEAQALSPAAARQAQPALGRDPAAAVYTPEDWRLDPRRLLPAMVDALVRARGRLHADPAPTATGGDALILATGAGEGARLAPELAVLTPIGGQVLHLSAGPRDGPALRYAGGYLAPQAGGAVVGATMEPGRRPSRASPAAVARLRHAAAAWVPEVAAIPGVGRAGVRASTPDGLPLAGASTRAGLFLATGARRNGWLLAPLAAEAVLAAVAGARHPAAALVDPQRFSAHPMLQQALKGDA